MSAENAISELQFTKIRHEQNESFNGPQLITKTWIMGEVDFPRIPVNNLGSTLRLCIYSKKLMVPYIDINYLS